MTETAVESIAARLEKGQTLAALDLGMKTIGVAVSDAGLSFANPRPVLRRTKFGADIAALEALFVADNVGAVVIGLPVNMDGTQGPRVQSARAFARNMGKHIPLPFAFWDERLSTIAAERALVAQDVSRAKRAARIDSAAAALILQGVLDRLHSAGATG